jgi:predicted transcriptional regulator
MLDKLPRREREVLEVLSRLSSATVGGIRAGMSDPPSYSAVRTILGRLEAKKLVRRRSDVHAHIYQPVEGPAKIQESILRKLVDTLFGGSALGAATALISLADRVDESELEALQEAIDRSKARSS